MAITLRLVTGSVLTYGQVDANFSSLFYSASQSGSSLVFHTTGSIVQAATTTPFNLGLGFGTVATGQYSHAQGYNTIASGDYQHVQGQYNIASSAQSAFIIGNGTAEGSRSNLLFASGSKVQITGSLIVTKNIDVRESVFAGTYPPSGTSGGYLLAANYLDTTYSQFVFYSKDDADRDNFGNVTIFANAEEGIYLNASAINGSNPSTVEMSQGQLLMTNSRLQITSATASLYSSNYFKIVSPSVQITGSLNASAGITGSFKGDGSQITGITSEWDGSLNGNATITGSLVVSNNIGIGTPTPLSKLDISGSVSISGNLTNNSTRPAVSSGILTFGEIRGYSITSPFADDGFLRLSAGGGSSAVGKSYIDISGYSNIPDMNNNLVFGTVGSEKMRITYLGVLIGTTSGTSAKLQVEATGTTHAIIGTAITGSGIQASSQTGSGASIFSNSGTGLQVSSYTGPIIRGIGGSGDEYFKLFSNGNLSLHPSQGTGATKTDTGYKLYVGGTTNIDGNTTITGSLSNGSAGNIASGNYSHAEGGATEALGEVSHAEGIEARASGLGSHAEGSTTRAFGETSHAEGVGTVSSGSYSHAEGSQTLAFGLAAHSEGQYTTASGWYSHAEGSGTIASGSFSHAEGQLTISTGDYSHAEGQSTSAIGNNSHAEGSNVQAIGPYSHAEGSSAVSTGYWSHAEGEGTNAIGNSSHAEGFETIASGSHSHAEGSESQAQGESSHAEGEGTISSGFASHTEGLQTVASGSYQHVQGQFNISSSAQSAFIHGNGTSDGSRSNLIYAVGSTVEITGSLMLNDILVLAPRTTTPTPSPGMVIVSGSGVDQHIYCYLNSTWKQLD